MVIACDDKYLFSLLILVASEYFKIYLYIFKVAQTTNQTQTIQTPQGRIRHFGILQKHDNSKCSNSQ